MVQTDPSSQLPLTAVVLHILLALADGERHGYAIAQEIEETTHGQIHMGPGTLYGSIQRMLGASLIEEAPQRRRAADLFVVVGQGISAQSCTWRAPRAGSCCDARRSRTAWHRWLDLRNAQSHMAGLPTRHG